MNKVEELMQAVTEADEFDARAFFMGALGELAARGFVEAGEPVHDAESWYCAEGLPIRIWVYMSHGGQVVNVSVELDMRDGCTPLNKWSYPVDQKDAAFAQVDRIIPITRHFGGIPGREEACALLRAMTKAPIGESEEELDAREFMLGYEATLKAMGFDYVENLGAYFKSYPVSPDGQVCLVAAIYYDTPHDFADIYIMVLAHDGKETPIIKVIKSIPVDGVYDYVNKVSQAASALKVREPVNSQDVVQLCAHSKLLESEQEFDAREYLLGNPIVDMLKPMGYKQLGDSDCYSKDVVSDGATTHYLTVYGTEFPGDPLSTIVEYQKAVPQIGFVFPWSSRIEQQRLGYLLPVLERALKSAVEQEMLEVDLKRALDVLVK